MSEVRSKSGNGAFHLTVNDDGSVLASIEASGEASMKFDSAQRAYDFVRPLSADPSYWNLAYHLEDFLILDEEDATHQNLLPHERH